MQVAFSPVWGKFEGENKMINREDTIEELKMLARRTEVPEVKAILLSLSASVLVGSERHFAEIVWKFTEDELANLTRLKKEHII